MKQTKKKVSKMTVLIVFIAAAVLIGCSWRFLSPVLFPDKHILDKDGMINHRAHELTGVSYQVSGGSEGERFSMDIITDESGRLIYTYYNCPYNGAEETEYSREITLDEFYPIQEYCRTSLCLLREEGKPFEPFLEDAPVTSMAFILEGGTQISFHNDYEYSPEYTGLYSAVHDILFSFYPAG